MGLTANRRIPKPGIASCRASGSRLVHQTSPETRTSSPPGAVKCRRTGSRQSLYGGGGRQAMRKMIFGSLVLLMGCVLIAPATAIVMFPGTKYRA